MAQVGTVGELLRLAIQAERQAESLYHAVGKMFIEHTAVARFWMNYANEEAGHARWMERLATRIAAEDLAKPADPEMWQRAVTLVKAEPEALLNGIDTLQDAWELANEMEHGETNIIFKFLIENFTADAQTLAFLRVQLHDHLDHLRNGLPEALADAQARRAVVAKR